jgi:hypothetical protein
MAVRIGEHFTAIFATSFQLVAKTILPSLQSCQKYYGPL